MLFVVFVSPSLGRERNSKRKRVMNVRRSCFPHRLRPMGIDPDLRLKREGIEVKGLAADTPLGKRGE